MEHKYDWLMDEKEKPMKTLPGEYERQEQQKREQEAARQQQIQDDLTRLRTWDTEGGQTLQEQRRGLLNRLIPKQQEDVNLLLQQGAMQQIGAANAGGAADGTPDQELTPAKKTYKQKREETRRANEAKKLSKNPNADHISYNMVERLQNRENAAEAYVNEQNVAAKIQASGVEPNLVKAFYKDGSSSMMGYVGAVVAEKNVEAEERVAAPQDKERIQTRRLAAQMQRRAAVKHIVDEMLQIQITPEMFNDAYLEVHIDEMKALAERMRAFKVIRSDPKNAVYFNEKNLETSRRVALLDGKLNLLTDSFCAQLDYAAGQKAVDVGKGGYLKESHAQDQLQEVTKRLQGMQQAELKCLEGDAEKEMENLVGSVKKQRTDARTPSDAAQRCTGVLEGMEKTFRENPENYDKYKGAAGSLYQEAYRLTDVIADLADQAEAYRQVCDRSKDSDDILKKGIADGALAKQKECEERIAALEKQLGMYTGALEYYLKDSGDNSEKRVEPSRDIGNLIISHAISGGCMEKLAEKVFMEKGGIVDKVNAAYTDLDKKDAAILALDFRTDQRLSAMVNKSFRGDIFKGDARELWEYFGSKRTEAENIVKPADLENGWQGLQVKDGWSYGLKDFEDLSEDMMDKAMERFTSEQGIAYFRGMLPYIEEAAVFKDDSARLKTENQSRSEAGKETEVDNSALAVLAQDLMLRFSAVFPNMQPDSEPWLTKASGTVSKALLRISREVTRISAEEENKLPENIKRLLTKYRNGLKTVEARLQQEKEAANAAADVDNAAVNQNILDGEDESGAGA